MALSLAQRHRLRVLAELEAAAASPLTSMAGATAYELQLAQLLQDRLRLKNIEGNERKAALKIELLPTYEPYIEGVLAGGNGAQDEVMTTLMVWAIDAGAFPHALKIAGYVLKHNLIMPDRFARSTGCLIAEEVAEAALKAQKAGGAFDLQTLLDTEELTRERDMPDEARAKLHLAIGRALAAQVTDETPTAEQMETLKEARGNLTRAIALHTSCGGKKDLERVDRLLKKHAGPAS
ncbi:phage terminase small subunit [Pseudomonas sp. Sample_24]|uniref:phage terminase small subunit n=1 Tax=Pseudomonas sp. Sample_24 TaxID=2448268 RepID=UPI0010329446|nr:phage terminase small subunit [Pseudomonas sp. Sample_24]